MDIIEYLDEMNDLFFDALGSDCSDEHLDNITFTIVSVANQMGWEIEWGFDDVL